MSRRMHKAALMGRIWHVPRISTAIIEHFEAMHLHLCLNDRVSDSKADPFPEFLDLFEDLHGSWFRYGVTEGSRTP